ncbi:lysosomal proton-coupled steroid conjugate and bile acid symporter SLC46A3-like [Haliotis asinina]|uniref:lysosomal proton-coupled steroid conjugate and bile acid symporter SLC46A3-like n=1 Tax=Haliotis asinina TaxID=109174 RepID=UPI003532403D
MGKDGSSNGYSIQKGDGDGDVNTTGVPLLRAMVACGTVAVLYMAGVLAMSPVMTQLVRKRIAESYTNNTNISIGTENTCRRNKSNDDNPIEVKIQQHSADMLLYLSISGSITSTFVNLVIGSYSDFLGRRVLFFMPNLGAALNGAVLCLVVWFQLSLNWLFLGCVLQGLSGSFNGYLLGVFAYTADVTVPGKKRTVMIAIVEGFFAVAGSVGQLAVGFILDKVSYFYAAIMITAVFTLPLILIFTILPETMTKKVEKQWSPLPHIKKVLGFFTTQGSGKQRALYTLALLIFFLGMLRNMGRSSVEILYQLDEPFCWSSLKIGYYGAIRLSFSVLSSLFGIKLLQLCIRDMTIALLGLALGAASMVMEALAFNDWMIYSVPLIGLLSFTVVPIARSAMSKMTSPTKQGAMFSSIAAAESVCGVVAQTLYMSIYRSTVDTFRGAVFIVMAGMGGLCAVFIIAFLQLTKGDAKESETVVEPPVKVEMKSPNKQP